MNGADLFGYVASILVFGTFYMKQMLPLRFTAIASNVAFISYAWMNGLTPVLLLHGALLPLNLLRLVQQRRLITKAAAQGHPTQTNEFAATKRSRREPEGDRALNAKSPSTNC